MKKEEKKLLIELLSYDIDKWGNDEEIRKWKGIVKEFNSKGMEVIKKYNSKRKDYMVGVVIEFIEKKENMEK